MSIHDARKSSSPMPFRVSYIDMGTISQRVALLLLALVEVSGCYAWTQVPAGVQQKVFDVNVDGLLQHYTLLIPAARLAQNSRPLSAVLVLHSGFSGDDPSSADIARLLAQQGMMVVMPAYRGEVRKVDGQKSQGRIEFCRGEVDDAYAGLTWLRQQPGVDPARIGVLGSSHGGCIALQLGRRVPWLRAIVTLSAPLEAASLLKHLEDKPYQTFFYNGILAAKLKSYTQTTPSEHPMSYIERSPLFGIAEAQIPMLIIHGTSDSIVPVKQACWLLAALRRQGRPIREFLVDSSGEMRPSSQSVCSPSQDAPAEKNHLRTEFVFLHEQGHSYAQAPRHTAQMKAVKFLSEELQP